MELVVHGNDLWGVTPWGGAYRSTDGAPFVYVGDCDNVTPYDGFAGAVSFDSLLWIVDAHAAYSSSDGGVWTEHLYTEDWVSKFVRGRPVVFDGRLWAWRMHQMHAVGVLVYTR